MDAMNLTSAISSAAASYPLNALQRMPLDQIDTDWRAAKTRMWPFSFFARIKVRKLLQTYAEKGKSRPNKDLPALLMMRKSQAAIQGNPVTPTGTTGPDIDARRLQEVVAFHNTMETRRRDVDSKNSDLFDDAVAELESAKNRDVRNALGNYLAVEAAVADKEHDFTSLGGVVPEGASVADITAGLATIQAEKSRLIDWVPWIERNQQASAAALEPIVIALASGCAGDDVRTAFERAYAAWWLPLALDANDVLRKFHHWEHADLIQIFLDLDDSAAKLASGEVIRRIAHELPANDTVPRKSELGVLCHQLRLKRPSMPIRKLLESLPQTVTKLAPCVLMSPLSIAQYLPAGQATFDLVIFDEASQITTWDAIGAISRARQTVIVDDPKQLPPTNFFDRTEETDNDLPEMERDMPSILDEVSTSGFPTHYLNWHYRSRDEALIAFSNQFYYENKLVTFPDPGTDSNAVQFHDINGTYARGRGRMNQNEDEAIANMVRKCLTLRLDLPEHERQTIGIITFNVEQQSLILNLLDEIRRDDSRLEWFFSDDREEPVIVKNLENIQGDERDVILFSITFGADGDGKLTMNFGALNQDGREKRLNVAVTHARRKLHVFASVRDEQIDLSRTLATGVRDLKTFLAYAERGPDTLPTRDKGSLGPAENIFKDAVANAFRSNGWEVRTQIGVSGFRVDLGVVHPDRAGRYLAGIECDGARDHSSATARDRDKVRQAVLEGLGWMILRVWSTDWFRNPDTVINRRHTELVRRLAADRAAETSLEACPPEDEGCGLSRHSSPHPNAGQTASRPSESTPKPANNRMFAGTALTDRTRMPHARRARHEMIPNRSLASVAATKGDGRTNRPGILPETAANTGPVKFRADPARFFDSDYSPTLRQMILSIVESQGPIPVDLLVREIASKRRWQRARTRIRQRVKAGLDDLRLDPRNAGRPNSIPRIGRALNSGCFPHGNRFGDQRPHAKSSPRGRLYPNPVTPSRYRSSHQVRSILPLRLPALETKYDIRQRT